MLIGPEFPEGILTTTGMDAAKSQDVLVSGDTPKHARLLAAGTDDGFAAGFNDARADEPSLFLV